MSEIKWRNLDFGKQEGFEISNFGEIRIHRDKIANVPYYRCKKLQPHWKYYKTKGLLSRSRRYFKIYQEFYQISCLVAKAFLENTENKPIVDHEDGNTLNNTLSNLRYLTVHENNMNVVAKKGYSKIKRLYYPQITLNKIHLPIPGYFFPEQARLMYLMYKLKYHPVSKLRVTECLDNEFPGWENKNIILEDLLEKHRMQEAEKKLDEKLRRRFRELKPKISEKTIIQYSSSYRRLLRVDENLEYHAIANYVKNIKPSIATVLLTSVIVHDGREKFGKLYEDIIKEVDELRGRQTFSKAELEKWTSPKVINAGISRAKFKVDSLQLLNPRLLPAKYFYYLMQYLTLRFYREFHWRSDLPTVRIGNHPGENYYLDGKFYLNKFKTSKAFGRKGLLPLVFEPSASLGRLVKAYIKQRFEQNFKHDYFLVNMQGNRFSKGTFNKFLTRTSKEYIGKPLSTTMLRKIYVTQHMNTNPSLAAKKLMARNMMQLQLETHEGYARFFEEEDNE